MAPTSGLRRAMTRVPWSLLHRATLFVLFVGLAFSLFATAETLDVALRSSCDVNPVFTCGPVDNSSYSHVGPIPDYAIGIGGFLVMILLEVLLIQRYEPVRVRLLLTFSFLGLLVSLALGYTEVAFIHVICPICLGAYLSNVGVLLCAMTMQWKRPPKSYRLRLEKEARTTPSRKAQDTPSPREEGTAEDGESPGEDEGSDETA